MIYAILQLLVGGIHLVYGFICNMWQRQLC